MKGEGKDRTKMKNEDEHRNGDEHEHEDERGSEDFGCFAGWVSARNLSSAELMHPYGRGNSTISDA